VKEKLGKDSEKKSSATGATLSGRLPVVLGLNSYPAVSEILVVGCGGTGAYIISHLSRLISVVNRTRSVMRSTNPYTYNKYEDIKLYLADGDSVEDKNLNRQHFIHQDINRNKAEVLGERYSAAFGIQIGVILKDLEKVSDFDFLNVNGNSSTVIIGCVDNNASRKTIRDWFVGEQANYNQSWASKFWIDSGNEERNGQVVCGFRPSDRGYYGTKKLNPSRTMISDNGEFSLPCVTEVYPSIMDDSDQFNSQISCAERAESSPQNMQTNVTAATITMNYINKIIAHDPIKSHCVEFSIDNNFSTKLNTPENLSVVNMNRRRYWEKQ
jgi:PRTRC genetic system ThiF family protein